MAQWRRLSFIEDRLTPLGEALEVVRAKFSDKSMTITSGYRTETYDRSIEGVRRSQHVQGKAADIKVKGIPTKRVQQKMRALMDEGRIPRGGLVQVVYTTIFEAIVRRGDHKSRGRRNSFVQACSHNSK